MGTPPPPTTSPPPHLLFEFREETEEGWKKRSSKTRGFTQMSTTPVGHKQMLLLCRQPISQSSEQLSRQKILGMTSRQVSSLPARDAAIWFFTREESHHLVLKCKVLLSNWKIVMEQLTGVTSIPMSIRQLDWMPLTYKMQKHQKLLQIMSNGKFNCTSEMFSQGMSCLCRLGQALEDVRACCHTKLEHVSSCTTNTATCLGCNPQERNPTWDSTYL